MCRIKASFFSGKRLIICWAVAVQVSQIKSGLSPNSQDLSSTILQGSITFGTISCFTSSQYNLIIPTYLRYIFRSAFSIFSASLNFSEWTFKPHSRLSAITLDCGLSSSGKTSADGSLEVVYAVIVSVAINNSFCT